uniref:DUF1985 domain-containing protein n=1 Tax=Brassica oleracea var. oleracea TaxID=109376 RepID=A0A0D3BDB3_BRAOL
MELELPKGLYAEGLEPQVKKINNCCHMELIRDLKKVMSAEYNDVKIDPVFKHIMAIADNKLRFSGKLVDSFLCKQLITSKMHEKWFVFARERDEKVNIPDMYIKLVMDLDKLRKFHWGLHSYDFLLSSIEKARKKLGKKDSYIFEGFSYALQIWIMEAIPDFGEICGRQVSGSFVGPRCGNWKGVANISYEDIIELEDSLTKKGDLFSVISVSGNGDMFQHVDYTRKGEMEDERVDLLLDRIRQKFDWSSTEWPVLEPEETEMEEADSQDRGSETDKTVADTDVLAEEETSSVTVARKGKRKVLDEGAVTRKKKLLCKRFAGKNLVFGPETKSFIEGLIQTSVTSLGDKLSTQMANMERMFTERMGKMEIEVSQLRDAISLTGERRYPSKKAAEEAPLHSKAKQAPPKSKANQDPPKRKGAQAPPKRKGDQPTPTKKVLPKRKCRT